MRNRSLEDFYQEIAEKSGRQISELLPPDIHKDIGHFNVFDIADTIREFKRKQVMPYDRRAYYKISLIRGKNRAEYADKIINIKQNALLFATPKVPYHWVPEDEVQSGSYCVFTEAFMVKNKSGVLLDELPIFRTGGFPVFEISESQASEAAEIFRKMEREITSEYEYKYDLLRSYVLELIHLGQKWQPLQPDQVEQNASSRIVSLFIELLERQFPIETQNNRPLRSATEYAERLAIHVNHLNKVLKEQTGKTTTDLIRGRMIQEAKILLRQTDWTVSEIAFSLGFEEVAHFSNYFKKQTSLTPLAFRS
ncbi:MAG TPA: helix-turn-helix domain-containing protein [Saprospiraceae bacterium]|nr:AraC family transcriptional regulator [Lewinellaceae bacterium]HPQ98492.1 helix-turn-helix domain-containing protein [Saprospiraceae bacterium]HQU53915.1 helix-turn-helix domain-containing protein [Saprospiraceae bacterium]HRV85317.1 helix-turn-helix domain-containing protein [Saprospiraceae bacterium]